MYTKSVEATAYIKPVAQRMLAVTLHGQGNVMSTLQDCTPVCRHSDVSRTRNCPDQQFALLVQGLHGVPTQVLR